MMKSAMAMQLTAIVFLAFGSGAKAQVPSDAKESLKPLRVLSYNIHHGEGMDGKLDLPRIAKVILSCQPDLVSLQEVDRNVRRTGNVDQAEELARLTKMHGVFGKSIDLQGGGYGNAVLSRLPIRKHQTRPLPSPADRERRSVLEVEVDATGYLPDGDATLVFWATHLDHVRDETNRLASAKAMTQLSDEITQPLILAGDLNATHDRESIRLILERFVNPAGDQVYPTIPVDRPTRQIDYVLHCNRYKWKAEVRVLDEPIASDHLPILTVLEFQGRAD